jgi:hypothetical protein
MTEPMVIAEFETPHFTFVTIAPDRETAYAQLHAAWQKHAAATGADPEVIEDYLGDVSYFDIRVGEVLRDGELFAGGKA